MTKPKAPPRDLADDLVKGLKQAINFMRGKKTRAKVTQIEPNLFKIEQPIPPGLKCTISNAEIKLPIIEPIELAASKKDHSIMLIYIHKENVKKIEQLSKKLNSNASEIINQLISDSASDSPADSHQTQTAATQDSGYHQDE